MLNWSGLCVTFLLSGELKDGAALIFSSVKILISIWAQHILRILLFLNQAYVLLVSKNKQYKRCPNCALSYVWFKYQIAAKLTHLVEIFNVIFSFFRSYSSKNRATKPWYLTPNLIRIHTGTLCTTKGGTVTILHFSRSPVLHLNTVVKKGIH